MKKTREKTTHALSVQITHNMVRNKAADSGENTHIRLLALRESYPQW